MKRIVVSTVDTAFIAENIVSRLHSSGLDPSAISVLLPNPGGAGNILLERATKAPEGAAVGGSAGAIVGGALGLLAGLGALVIPGLGPFVAAGPIFGALSGAALGGAALGITGALIGFGLPEAEAKQYEARVRAGGLLLVAHTENAKEVALVKQTFTDCGAHDIVATFEAQVPPATGVARPSRSKPARR